MFRTDMDPTASARQLNSQGKYRAALAALPAADIRRDLPSTRLMRAELHAWLGETASARPIIENLLGAKNLSDADRSHLEFISSRIAQEDGEFDEELQH